ncbi:N-acetyl sugar amidotransferase [Candidatus Nucleicultrix amoebiphila]|uniref:N-acetyl sugar amidotransferase n=1 Tax=Candidatus Nucleicultrix amoebiphila TaxID=1509244 RepID=UPI0012F4BA38|nr:N-acetyl sugar amidotransferase [Candidatus Nucleicultrix amoebiphila]
MEKSAVLNIDANKYAPSKRIFQPKYGLPSEIQFCTNCVISNQRPNSCVEYQHNSFSVKKTIGFNENGLCDACLLAEQKKNTIDWEIREKSLIELCNRFRKNNGEYDCLVPGSGGKDSFYAAHILKHKYGMHPLTVTWAPHMYTDWGWKNFQSWVHAGFDNYLCTPNGQIHRLLTRLAVENLFHPFQPFIIGQKAYAPKMAALFDIPLVFYGENEAEYGNPIADTKTALRDRSYFSQPQDELYLGGVSISDLQKKYGISKADLTPYLPMKTEDLERKNIEVHYLGYYLNWHPQSCYYYSIENSNFQAAPERTPGTYSKYNSIDDKIDDLHYFTTYIKFGIGRASYDAAQEIRSGDITREEGIALVKRYDGEFPERFFDEILSYLSLPPKEFPVAAKMFDQPIMDRAYFETLTNKFRSDHLWMHDGQNWKLRKTIYEA